jgi:hypothetical protein
VVTAPATSAVFRRLAENWDDTRSYLRRPCEWSSDKLDAFLWSKQREIKESVRDNRYTVVHSAHELGKSFIAADTVAWWIDSHAPGEAFVITTAPSAAQVSAILWREISKMHGKADLRGRINRAGYPQWYIGPELVGYGRKPADYEESAFQGIHARYVLVVIDEAGGVSQTLYNAIDSIVANATSRVLAIGNPDDPGSHFARICKPDSDWHVIHLDGLRSPNMSRERVIGPDPAKPRYPLTAALMDAEAIPYSEEPIPPLVRELLLDPLWVEERIIRWGGVPKNAAETTPPEELARLIVQRTASSALFTAKVRGLFPTSGSEGVIPLGWVQRAIERWHDWMDRTGGDTSQVDDPTRHILGIDVARYGSDESVFAERYGSVCTALHRERQMDTIETSDAAAQYLHETKSLAVVDVIGIGAGVFDTLRKYRRQSLIQAEIIPFNASGASWRRDVQSGSFKFRNDRAAAWWNMREALDPSRGSKVCLPDDERMLEELVAPRYKLLAGGIIQVESKDDIRRRLGRSTDSADAVIQAWWYGGADGHTTDEPIRYGQTRARPLPYAGTEQFAKDDALSEGSVWKPEEVFDAGEAEWERTRSPSWPTARRSPLLPSR